MHPLLRTLALEPQLALEHAAGYVELAGVESREALRHWQRRWLLGLLAVALGVLALGLTGTAVLLLAVQPVAAMPYPALLALPPLVAALAALALWAWLRHHPTPAAFALLRAQWQDDCQLMERSGGNRA